MARTAGSTAAGTRRRIVDAAVDLFTSQGYAGTSMRDITERVGITKAALYYHFPSKDDLLDELVRPLVDGLDAFTAYAADARADRAELAERLVTLMGEQIGVLHPFFGDPAAQAAIEERHELHTRVQRLHQVLADGDDPAALLRAGCAVGAIFGGVTLALRLPPPHRAARQDPPVRPRTALTGEDRSILVRAVLAVLQSASPAVPAVPATAH